MVCMVNMSPRLENLPAELEVYFPLSFNWLAMTLLWKEDALLPSYCQIGVYKDQVSCSVFIGT